MLLHFGKRRKAIATAGERNHIAKKFLNGVGRRSAVGRFGRAGALLLKPILVVIHRVANLLLGERRGTAALRREQIGDDAKGHVHFVLHAGDANLVAARNDAGLELGLNGANLSVLIAAEGENLGGVECDDLAGFGCGYDGEELPSRATDGTVGNPSTVGKGRGEAIGGLSLEREATCYTRLKLSAFTIPLRVWHTEGMNTIIATLEPDSDGTLHVPLPPELRSGKVVIEATLRAEGEAAPKAIVATPEMMAQRKSALQELRAMGGLRDAIPDPVAWQKEQRQDRPLPGRE